MEPILTIEVQTHPGQKAIIDACQNALNGQAELERKAALCDEVINIFRNPRLTQDQTYMAINLLLRTNRQPK